MKRRELGSVEAHWVTSLPGQVDLVLKLPTLFQHGCWIGQQECQVVGRTEHKMASLAQLEHVVEVEDHDFRAWFNETSWVVEWKWQAGQQLPRSSESNYLIANTATQKDTTDKE